MILNEALIKHSRDDAERILLKNIVDKINLTIKKGVSTHTPFLNPDQVIMAIRLLSETNQEVKVQELRLTEDSEYTILVFTDSDDLEPKESVMGVIKLTYPKQFAELGHKDILGTLMSLGLKREAVGDIRTMPGEAYVAIIGEMTPYIVNNLTHIKHVGVIVKEIAVDDVPTVEQKYQTLSETLASLRLDVFVAAVTRLSREKAQNAVASQKIKLNYRVCEERSQILKEGDLISIRGFGRYRLESVMGETKKNRLRVIIKHTIS